MPSCCSRLMGTMRRIANRDLRRGPERIRGRPPKRCRNTVAALFDSSEVARLPARPRAGDLLRIGASRQADRQGLSNECSTGVWAMFCAEASPTAARREAMVPASISGSRPMMRELHHSGTRRRSVSAHDTAGGGSCAMPQPLVPPAPRARAGPRAAREATCRCARSAAVRRCVCSQAVAQKIIPGTPIVDRTPPAAWARSSTQPGHHRESIRTIAAEAVRKSATRGASVGIATSAARRRYDRNRRLEIFGTID